MVCLSYVETNLLTPAVQDHLSTFRVSHGPRRLVSSSVIPLVDYRFHTFQSAQEVNRSPDRLGSACFERCADLVRGDVILRNEIGALY